LLIAQESLRQRERELEETRESLEGTQSQLREMRVLIDVHSATEESMRQLKESAQKQMRDTQKKYDDFVAQVAVQGEKESVMREKVQKQLMEMKERENEMMNAVESLKLLDKELEHRRLGLESTQKSLKEAQYKVDMMDISEDVNGKAEALAVMEELLAQRERELGEARECTQRCKGALRRSQELMVRTEENLNTLTDTQESAQRQLRVTQERVDVLSSQPVRRGARVTIEI